MVSQRLEQLENILLREINNGMVLVFKVINKDGAYITNHCHCYYRRK